VPNFPRIWPNLGVPDVPTWGPKGVPEFGVPKCGKWAEIGANWGKVRMILEWDLGLVSPIFFPVLPESPGVFAELGQIRTRFGNQVGIWCRVGVRGRNWEASIGLASGGGLGKQLRSTDRAESRSPPPNNLADRAARQGRTAWHRESVRFRESTSQAETACREVNVHTARQRAKTRISFPS
jgi:hypothetical protein